MRQILIDKARHKKSLKAGAAMRRVDLDDVEATLCYAPDDLLDLDDALTKLAGENPAAAELAKLRLFVGMTIDNAAQSLGVSRRTGFRHWTYARSFLQAEMTGDSPRPSS
jgi:RNA polymerase sigma factor (TIGR02999 family)